MAKAVRKKKRHKVTNTKGQNILARERERRALELRKAGATYGQIAEQIDGYGSAQAASTAVRRALENMVLEPASDLLGLQYERLNHMLLTLWPKVQQGDLASVDRVLRIMAEMDRLMGTGAPQQSGTTVNVGVASQGGDQNVLVIEGDRDTYIERLKQMAGDPPDPKELEAGEQPVREEAQPEVSEDDWGHEDDSTVIDAEVIEEACEQFVRPKGTDRSSRTTVCARCGVIKGEH